MFYCECCQNPYQVKYDGLTFILRCDKCNRTAELENSQVQNYIEYLIRENKVLRQEVKDYKERFLNEVETGYKLPLKFISAEPSRGVCDLCYSIRTDVKKYNVWNEHNLSKWNLCPDCYNAYKAKYFKQKEEKGINNESTPL